MPAETRVITFGRSSAFPARYHGTCPCCLDDIRPGDMVLMVSSRARHDMCRDDDEATDEESVRTVPARQVMPHGRTASDRCGRCFQIPASNGVCGCD